MQTEFLFFILILVDDKFAERVSATGNTLVRMTALRHVWCRRWAVLTRRRIGGKMAKRKVRLSCSVGQFAVACATTCGERCVKVLFWEVRMCTPHGDLTPVLQDFIRKIANFLSSIFK